MCSLSDSSKLSLKYISGYYKVIKLYIYFNLPEKKELCLSLLVCSDCFYSCISFHLVLYPKLYDVRFQKCKADKFSFTLCQHTAGTKLRPAGLRPGAFNSQSSGIMGVIVVRRLMSNATSTNTQQAAEPP